MPRGDPVRATTDERDRVVRPAQIPNPYQDIISAGGLDVADGTPITDPEAEITNSETHIYQVQKFGTTLRIRMAYPRGVALTTDLVIQVFGRFASTNAWQKLTNKSGDHEVPVPQLTATDVDDGVTFQYTDVDPNDHSWDLDGNEEILVGVRTALDLAGSNEALAKLQAKII